MYITALIEVGDVSAEWCWIAQVWRAKRGQKFGFNHCWGFRFWKFLNLQSSKHPHLLQGKSTVWMCKLGSSHWQCQVTTVSLLLKSEGNSPSPTTLKWFFYAWITCFFIMYNHCIPSQESQVNPYLRQCCSLPWAKCCMLQPIAKVDEKLMVREWSQQILSWLLCRGCSCITCDRPIRLREPPWLR